MKTYVIGAGGVGSFAVPALCLLIKNENVIVMDGDVLERKNLNRQLFSGSDIGRKKSDALAARYGCASIPDWFHYGARSYERGDWIICVVDNHPGRMAVLETCDLEGCRAIFAANETHSAEAYVYLPQWKGTNLDPRIMFPEIETDRSGDPRRASVGCTGEAQSANAQLVTANFMAASLALHLYVVWAQESRKLPDEALPHLPHRLVNNLSRMESFKAQIKERTVV